MTSEPETYSEYARRIVLDPSLEVKLRRPVDRSQLLDDGETIDPLPTAPGRSPDLEMVPPGTAVKVPPARGMADVSQRIRLLHALANHELQAAELYAWALLAFPNAPAEFRRGLFHILCDEQRHTQMYIARLEALGGRFGAYPVSGYFWNKLDGLTTPLEFVCAMALTFENANLDHTTDNAAIAREIGDPKTAAVVDKVHADEVEHVRFGWRWLAEMKSETESMWDAYRRNLASPLEPNRAIGRTFHEEGRRAAGLETAFIESLRSFTTNGRYPRWD